MTKLIETMPVQIPSGSHLSSCGSRAFVVIDGGIVMSGIAAVEGSLVRDRHVAADRGYATTQTFAGPPAWRPPTS